MPTNHFIYAYDGNKRNEFNYINDFINNSYDDYDTIIEPFCGTSSISFNIWLKYPNKKFILNDNNNDLIQIYNLIKNVDIDVIKNKLLDIKTTINNDKNIFNSLYKSYCESSEKDVYQNLFFNKIQRFNRIGLYCECKFKDFSKEQYKFFDFIKTANIEISNKDWFEIFKEYSNDEKSLIFFDPPYLLSHNMFYKFFNNNVYEFFSINDINQYKAKIIFILEHNWIIKLLFKNPKKQTIYKKKYEISKKTVNHIIFSN